MTTGESTRGDSFWLPIILIVSVAVSGLVAFLILGPRPEGLQGALDVSALPAVNATLNGCAGLALLVAFGFIRSGNITAHKRSMFTAFFFSTAFLLTYVLYHWFKSGPKQYTGELKWLYYPMLATHIPLAAIIVPLALVTLYRGVRMERAKHKKIARITLPIWLYVSATGVGIYAMLYW